MLEETQEPLSFIIFIPEWRDPPTEALIRLDHSRCVVNLTNILNDIALLTKKCQSVRNKCLVRNKASEVNNTF